MSMRCDRVLFVLAVICLFGSGCFHFDGRVEYRDMSYADYKARVATRVFDPVGAASISYLDDFRRDEFDDFWKMQIPKADWIKVLKQLGLKEPRPFDPGGKTEMGLPHSWPKPSTEPPTWWLPDGRFGSLIATSQEQEQPGKRAKGWYWLYDDRSSTAIAWNWNRQSWTFAASSAAK